MKFPILLFTMCYVLSFNAFAEAGNLIEKKLLGQIKNAESTIKELRRSANLVDDNYHIGTMHNEIDAKEHSCYALGMLLGQEKSVEQLNINKKPIIQASSSDEAYAQRLMAQSLENFIQATRYVINLSEDERAMEWNLDCVGHFKIPRNFIPQGQITFYKVMHDGKMLQILGNIESGFSKKLQQAIELNPSVRVVALGSGGGLVKEALSAGRYIRSKNLETTLWNNCYSACPLVFLGGKARTIMSPYPYLGFHKIYTKQGTISSFDPIYREVADYAKSMGVSSDYILKNMFSAEPSQMRVVKESEDLCKYGVTTWIQRVC